MMGQSSLPRASFFCACWACCLQAHHSRSLSYQHRIPQTGWGGVAAGAEECDTKRRDGRAGGKGKKHSREPAKAYTGGGGGCETISAGQRHHASRKRQSAPTRATNGHPPTSPPERSEARNQDTTHASRHITRHQGGCHMCGCRRGFITTVYTRGFPEHKPFSQMQSSKTPYLKQMSG